MNEKDFMRQVSAHEMPDITEVKNACIEKLNEHKSKKRSYKVAYIAGAAAFAVAACLCITPVKSFAQNVIEQFRAMLNLNNDEIDLGEAEEICIDIPDDCEEYVYEGVTYLGKRYDNISDISKDIGVDIYSWTGFDEYIESGGVINIVENDYCRISMGKGFTHMEIDSEMHPTIEERDDLPIVDMDICFPLSQETTLGELMLQDKQLKYATIDDSGNIHEYQQNIEYELVEQYDSKTLDTRITVIAEKNHIEMTSDYGEATSENISYYIYFTLEGMRYQVNCIGTLDEAHDVIENMVK